MADEQDIESFFRAARRGDIIALAQNPQILRDINVREEHYGETVLMMSAFNGKIDCVQWFLQRPDIQIDIRDNTNQTALIKAARNGNVECTDLLIQAGANVNIIDVRHLTPLMHAVYNGHKECARSLIRAGVLLDVVDNLGSTALMKAAYASNSESMRDLLNAGALVNIRDNNDQTALMKSSANSNTECVHMLLEKGAHADLRDRKGNTAIVKVACMWNPSTAPSENFREKGYQCIGLLSIEDVNVNAADCENETVLMKAASIGFTKCVKFLLRLGARIDIFNSVGQSAIMLAARHGHAKIVDLLCTKVIRDMRGTRRRAYANDVLNLADFAGFDAILHAARNKKGDCVIALVSHGVEVDVVDTTGTTPLMHMARAGEHRAIRALLEAGADAGRINVNGETALEMVANDACRHYLIGR